MLTDYDNKGHNVFIQLEPGHFVVTQLITMAMKRFYVKGEGAVKHPSICGIGLDIEWHKDTNPDNDGESVTAADVNKWD